MIQSPRTAVRIFGIIFTATMLSAVVGAGLFNYLIDPYAVFGTRTLAGVNVIKPRPDVMLSDIKLIVGARFRPNALILGNSRAEVGFDPVTRFFWLPGLRGYNAAIPGSGLDDAAHAFKLFATTNRIKVAVLGIDFLDFLYSAEEPAESSARGIHVNRKDALVGVVFNDRIVGFDQDIADPGQAESRGSIGERIQSHVRLPRNRGKRGISDAFPPTRSGTGANSAKKPHNLYVGEEKCRRVSRPCRC